MQDEAGDEEEKLLIMVALLHLWLMINASP
jgi:hypothetical protein